MRSLIVRTMLVLGLIGVIVPGEARAQYREKTWELFPYIGHMSFSAPGFGDVVQVRFNRPAAGQTEIKIVESTIQDESGIGLRFAYHWTKSQMIEFAFEGNATDAKLEQTTTVENTATGAVQSVTVRSESLSVDFLIGQVNYVHNFSLHRRDKVVAYLSGGIGIVNTSVFGLTGQPDFRPILDEYVGETNEVMYNVGGGIRFFGSEKVGFRIDLRQVEYTPDNREKQDYFEIAAGVTLILGGA